MHFIAMMPELRTNFLLTFFSSTGLSVISDHQKMSFPATVDSLFYTCLLINTDQESSSEPMSSEKDMAIAELPDVCAVVEVATENEEPEDQHTEVSLPLQDSHVSSYSGNVLSCLYL